MWISTDSASSFKTRDDSAATSTSVHHDPEVAKLVTSVNVQLLRVQKDLMRGLDSAKHYALPCPTLQARLGIGTFMEVADLSPPESLCSQTSALRQVGASFQFHEYISNIVSHASRTVWASRGIPSQHSTRSCRLRLPDACVIYIYIYI